MKNLKTVIAALGVFAMTIGSGFAMDNNSPTEPVKVIGETEIVEAPMQTVYMGPVVYFNSDTNECVKVETNPGHCTLTVELGNECTIDIGLKTYFLYEGVHDPFTNKWSCRAPLYRIPTPL